MARADLLLPLLISLAIAWADLRTRRIPNYLTLGGAAAGMGYQLGYHGWPGLADSLAGLILGLALLLFPYWKGGMGGGDVKALAAMGAWLGVKRTFFLFIYMGLSGGLIILVVLWRRGLLRTMARQGWVFLVNLLLCASQGGLLGGRDPEKPDHSLWNRPGPGDDPSVLAVAEWLKLAG